MVYRIIWTIKALKSYDSITSYLQENFSNSEIIKFSNEIDGKLQLIKVNPAMGRASSNNPDIHKTIILNRVLLVYRVMHTKNVIYLLDLWDARQNPKKFRYD